MAKGSGGRGHAGGRRPAPTPRKSTKPSPKPKPRVAKNPPAAPDFRREPPRRFTLGVVPGATPGKWITAWRERLPHVELVLRPIAVAEQLAQLASGELDAALVRLPLEGEQFHIIRLYDETPVAIVSADSHLTAVDELALSDLAGEVVIVPDDDVLGAQVPGGIAPAFPAPVDTEQAVETVATGVGVVLAPMSLARLHARKDVASRPVRDAPVSTMALAWPREAGSADVDTFVGIVRGRTAHSSR